MFCDLFIRSSQAYVQGLYTFKNFAGFAQNRNFELWFFPRYKNGDFSKLNVFDLFRINDKNFAISPIQLQQTFFIFQRLFFAVRIEINRPRNIDFDPDFLRPMEIWGLLAPWKSEPPVITKSYLLA